MSAGNVSEGDENKSHMGKSTRTIGDVSRFRKRQSVLDKRTTYATYAAYNAQGQQKTMVTSYVQAYEKNVDVQNREIAFDKRLREKANVKETTTAQ